MKTPEIENHLATLREKRGFSAAALAKAVSISRQTIYAMEAGSYIPNTAVALRLAQALEVTVEDLFSLAGQTPELPSAESTMLLGSDVLQPGQPVQLCRVDKRLMASAPSPVPWYFPASDAIVMAKSTKDRKTKVQIFNSGGDAEGDFRDRIMVAGCDPGISVLARHVRPSGMELVLAHRNSSQALALLKEGSIHVAGTHLRDEVSGESNLPEIARTFPKNTVAVIALAAWEEGIVTAGGNPKGIRGVEDFSRKDISIINREKGAGSRQLLDSRLKHLGIDVSTVTGYQHFAAGHLPAAWQVKTGSTDCCIATQAAARLFGLGFIPLVSERYDLVIRRQHLNLPAIQALLDTLNRLKFRRELESIGGYDTTTTGQEMM